MEKRYCLDETLNQPDEFVTFIINEFFMKNKFQQIVCKGEEVWHKSSNFLKYSYMNGVLHIEVSIIGLSIMAFLFILGILNITVFHFPL